VDIIDMIAEGIISTGKTVRRLAGSKSILKKAKTQIIRQQTAHGVQYVNGPKDCIKRRNQKSVLMKSYQN